MSQSPSENLQQEWEQLCDYARLCVESSETVWAEHTPAEGTPEWFLSKADPARFLDARDEPVNAPDRFVDWCEKTSGNGKQRLLYGYPSVVYADNGLLKLAPVCYLEIQEDRSQGGQAIVVAAETPRFNHGLLLSPASGTDQIEAMQWLDDIEQCRLEHSVLAFVKKSVEALGYNPSVLDTDSVQSSIGTTPGIHNAAVFMAGTDRIHDPLGH